MILARGFFEVPRLESLWEDIHHLTYQMHGGSGYAHSREDVLNETPDWLKWACKRLNRARKDDAEALKKK